jgi:N,N-dimethylformamidase
MWARRGRPARKLVGVEHSANVFVAADGRWGFERLPASYEDRFAFMFDGIDQEVIGNFGLNLGSAAGYEMDSVLEWAWPEDWRPTVLARAVHEAFIPPMRMPVPRACDIALTVSPRGAAVFAAGSVTWTGSLPHNGYDNNVSRLTDNVLRRFMEVERGEPVLRAE